MRDRVRDEATADGHDGHDGPPTARRYVRVAVPVAAAALLVWGAALIRFRSWNPNDDLAILQLQLERMGSGDIPLVGAYSRLDFRHPGPLREWVFGVTYWGSGRRAAALPATAVTLDLAWAAVACAMGWVTARRAGIVAAAVGAVLVFAGLDWNVHSAWNPHLAAPAAYAAAWGVVAVAATGARWWFVPVVAGSFAAQLHVSALPLGLAAVAVVVVVAVRDRRRRGAPRPALVVGVLVALWIGPLLDLTRGADSNVARILRNGGDDSLGWLDAGRHVGRMTLPWSIAAGDALRATGASARSAPFAVLVLLIAVLGVVLVAGLAVTRRRRAAGHGDEGAPDPTVAACATALGAVLVVWATVAVGFTPPAFPYLFAPSTGALALTSAALVLVAARGTRRLAAARAVRLMTAVGPASLAVVAVSWAVAGWTEMQPIATAPLQQQIDAAVREATVAGQRYDIDAAGLVESVAYGEVALAVQQAGGEPRSDIFALGLPGPEPGDPLLVAVMGEPLACLSAAGAPTPLVLHPSIASGLDVGVFLADGDDERAVITGCLDR